MSMPIYLNYVNLNSLRTFFLRFSPFEVLEVQFPYSIGLLGIFTLCTYLSISHSEQRSFIKNIFKDFFRAVFMVHDKIERGCRDFQYAPCSLTCTASPIISITHQNGAFFLPRMNIH